MKSLERVEYTAKDKGALHGKKERREVRRMHIYHPNWQPSERSRSKINQFHTSEPAD
jgi:hypothetical protein